MGERTADEWGRLAVSIQGWRWLPGMAIGGEVSARHRRVGDSWNMRSAMLDPRREYAWPDPDDAGTAGCLLALLGERAAVYGPLSLDDASPVWEVVYRLPSGINLRGTGSTLGRACIAVAAVIKDWPGGVS